MIPSSLETNLNFNRNNVHVVGEKVAEDIKRAEELINTASSQSNELPLELKKLSRQVGLYYLFYKRDKEQAHKFLREYEAVPEFHSLEQAEYYAFLGYGHSINGGDHSTICYK